MQASSRRCAPALTTRMENQPGAGAATFRELAGVGVNVDLPLPVRVSDDLFFAVICVDEAGKARRPRRAGNPRG
jgi:hypothetical protein